MHDPEKERSLSAPEIMNARQQEFFAGRDMYNALMLTLFPSEEQSVHIMQPQEIVDLYRQPEQAPFSMPKAVLNEIDEARQAVEAVFNADPTEEENAPLAA